MAGGSVTGNSSQVGGLVGYMTNNASINTAGVVNGKIEGNNKVGGLVGQAVGRNIVIEKAYAQARVEGKGTGEAYVGGLIGYAANNTSTDTTGQVQVRNTYSAGEVIENGGANVKYVAGLIGYTKYTTITNSYTVSLLTTNASINNIAGLTLSAGYTTATNSYWTRERQGMLSNGIGEAKTYIRLVEKDKYRGWDFTEIWDIEEGETSAYLRNMQVPDEVYIRESDKVTNEGEGNQENPYIIRTRDELERVRSAPNEYYKLANDIDLSESEWTKTIGTDDVPFTGAFDGDGHKITGLTINSGDYRGLFGNISGGTVKNLTIENANVAGGRYLGILAGNCSYGTIENIQIKEGSVTGSSYQVGGMIGYSGATINNVSVSDVNVVSINSDSAGGLIGYNSGSISNANATGGAVNGRYSIGGLVGQNYGIIDNVTVKQKVITGSSNVGGLIGANNRAVSNATVKGGSVTGSSYQVGGLIGIMGSGNISNVGVMEGKIKGNAYIGGLIGQASNNIVIEKAYAQAEVTGTSNKVGGLIGYAGGSSYSAMLQVNNSYSKGEIIVNGGTSASRIGGLIGETSYTTITNSYTATKLTTTGSSGIGGLVGYTTSSSASNSYWSKQTSGVTSSALGNENTDMTNRANFINWDFDTIWQIESGKTPNLR